MNCTDIVGYTHSDGYCLCTLHGTDDQGNELPDAGNESGKVQPVFACEETDTDLICDPCFTELHAAGKDVKDAIILEANIDDPWKEEDELALADAGDEETEDEGRVYQWDEYKADALRVLDQHPGPCVVKYAVYGTENEKSFETLLEACTWIGEQEQKGLQATLSIKLDDGTEYNVHENVPLRMGRLFDED